MQDNEPLAPHKLTSGKLLAKNTLWNLVGQGVPVIAAVFAIPLLIKGLGIERFGVLTLAWMVIGYFSLFDFGIGRALTKVVAEKLGGGQAEDIPAIAWTALSLMLLLGVVGAIIVALLSPWLVHSVLKIPVVLQQETLNTFYLLALSIPIVISTAGLRGILEAYQRFGLVNAIRVPMGLFMFIGPLMVLPFSNNLFSVVAMLAAGRLVAWFVHFVFCLRVAPSLKEGVTIRAEFMGLLFRFGGWMTVTNIVGPLMAYLDRFMIGALMSVVYVAYYATPYEIASNLGLIPGALAGVLFPAFAASFMQDGNRTALLFSRGVKYTFLSLFPLSLLIVSFSHEIIEFWLGGEFAQNSTRVLQWLVIGRFINGLAQIPFALIQSAGRPDLTAKLHFIELPFYLLIVWWAIGAYGIEGAAVVWVARVGVETLFLFAMAQRFLPSSKQNIRWMAFTMIVALLILALAFLLVGVAMKGAFLVLTLIVFTLLTWRYILDSKDKQNIYTIFSSSITAVKDVK